jgi:DNA repair protein RadC
MDKEIKKNDAPDREIIATESFTNGNKVYFFDYMRAVNGSYYIKLSRGDLQPDGSYIKKDIVFFEEDFEFLLEAMSSLFRTAGYQRAAIDAGRRPGGASEERTTGIKSWDPQYRPREKMIAEGPETMTDAELLALLISSGSPRETAVELAGRILASVDFNLRRLSEATVTQLCEFKGMGHAKSTTVMAAMELSVRIAYQKSLLGESKQG